MSLLIAEYAVHPARLLRRWRPPPKPRTASLSGTWFRFIAKNSDTVPRTAIHFVVARCNEVDGKSVTRKMKADEALCLAWVMASEIYSPSHSFRLGKYCRSSDFPQFVVIKTSQPWAYYSLVLNYFVILKSYMRNFGFHKTYKETLNFLYYIRLAVLNLLELFIFLR